MIASSSFDSTLDRRRFLAGAAGVALAAGVAPAHAQAPLLTVSTRQIEVMKKAATVFGVMGPNGRPGVVAREGDVFRGPVFNATADPLVMHWHGQIHAVAEQDRSRAGGGELAVGAADLHDFRLTAGTHWMHSHQLSEQQLLAAPMIALEKDAVDAQDVVVMLHDFSFRSPAEILAGLGGADGHGAHGAAPSKGDSHAGHGAAAGAMAQAPTTHGAMAMGAMAVHANDVVYDAFLANDRTLDDPDVVRVERGGRARLRIVNGATATAFFIDTGDLPATCVAVDGSPCLPFLAAQRFALAQGQRVDLIVQLPPSGGAFPIFAQVEAETRRTGFILATPGAQVSRVEGAAQAKAPNADLAFDAALRAARPLPERPADRQFHVMLGEEANYRWTINGAVYGEHRPLEAKLGERVEIMFMNPTSMMHPMHLHGFHFQLVGLGGRRFAGPMRDTVIVPPHTPVLVAVDLDKRGPWRLHCHHLYHMATGMMTDVVVA